MKVALFFLSLLVALSSFEFGLCHEATRSERLGGTRGFTGAGTSSFPRVYTAIVAAPSKETSGTSGIHFAAVVDLIDIVERGLPSPYDGTGEDYVKISFIVHNKEELERLEELAGWEPHSQDERLSAANINNFEIDVERTRALQVEAAYTEPDYDRKRRLQQFSTINGFSCYKDLEGSLDFLDDLASRANSVASLSATVKVIGTSYRKTVNKNQGHDIKVFTLTGNGVSNAGRSTEKGIFFAMTGIHAREYSPPELVGRWLESMVSGYGENAEITSVLDHTEIHVVLQANPDGREIAESNRFVLRRKNLNPEGGSSSSCGAGSYGVDLNRNFPFRWGLDSGSSSRGCDQTYRGSEPASEPEVKAIVNYVESIFPKDQRKADPEGDLNSPFPETANGIFFDIHAYGEIIIWPWGHQNLETGNDSGIEGLVNKFRHFNGYDYAGPTNGFSYPASGATDDWAYGALGAAATTLELGTSFYQNCQYFNDEILPQNLPVLTYAAKVAKAPYSITKGPDVLNLSFSPVQANDSISVVALASDTAWSSGNHPTSRQTLTEIRIFVDVHPYDDPSPVGSIMEGSYQGLPTGSGAFAIDMSGLSPGRHTVYVQATDSAGYKGPVTAGFFVKEETSATPGPTPLPTPQVTPSPTPVPGPTPCVDKNGVFQVDLVGSAQDCAWLQVNMVRFDFLCQLLDVAYICPATCGQCGVFV